MLRYNNVLAREHDTIKVDSSASSSFINTKAANVQQQDRQKKFKDQEREENQQGDCTNYNSNRNYISMKVNNGHEHEKAIGKSAGRVEYRNREMVTSKRNTSNKGITMTKPIPMQSWKIILVVKLWGNG